VPIVNMNGQTIWIVKPCWAESLPGSRFCLWHFRRDYLPPETCAMRPNKEIAKE